MSAKLSPLSQTYLTLNVAYHQIPSFPRKRESALKLEKPSFEKQFPNFKNGFPPVRE
ncbi:pilus assembly protein PilS [Neisseria meningitidis]|uniref:Pilus assembly protein PilS n=1 Tax=Neisseria meningitidis TaxID=487 RepID=A0A425B2S7_NEIME|nr:pilus assembly protein PilS [Neisseria meningitidis]MBG8633089.1 pilus assembly protein PilS [Neisseria meningitidis]MBG8659911.1 pilus assembly protein PilS [Neisseria meningitidis]MBG8745003.1 pilus assembly protein PilS [Neisseria meningitidis]MBG8767385.1 pilus assembly protein PilS [Neisseria meningitidis]